MTAESRSSVHGRRILSPKEAAPIKRDLRKAQAEYRLLEREWENMLRDHEGEWVAVHGGEFLFADSLEALIESAKRRGWPLGVMAIDQLTARRPAVLL